jgi:hypothetical protein
MIAILLGLHGRNPSQTRSSPFLAGYPVGPASTSPRAFHGWTWRSSCFSGFVWRIKLSPGSFKVKPWSGPVLKKSFEWRALFQRKITLTKCSPQASYYLEQKVGGSWIFIVGKTENLIWGYVHCSPEHISGFFLYKNSVIGSFVIFSSALPSVGGRW